MDGITKTQNLKQNISFPHFLDKGTHTHKDNGPPQMSVCEQQKRNASPYLIARPMPH